MTADRLRPDLKTWRMAEAARAAVELALEAAKAEGLESKVGRSLREAGLFLAGACTTLEIFDDAEETPLTATTMMPLSITDLSHLIATITGARDRLAAFEIGFALEQIDDLRTRLIDADQQLRQRVGLPLD